ncbi:MAG: hypothetical protein NZM11_11155, partial [Anaerolineales bacterium]|nr:hypothetical protein [Anaerolineales bacterium]
RETQLQLELAYARKAELQRALRETGPLSQESQASVRNALRTLEQTISAYEQAAMELSRHIRLQVERLVLAWREAAEARHLTETESENGTAGEQATRPETPICDDTAISSPN